ncbi:hypothetical protein ACE3MQ_27230 [Paenibacillus lentus]|uniref:hypothetical protein n=1 Tax=Paenibacillus lentus TaxID=1338368 RepID=UPI003654AED3
MENENWKNIRVPRVSSIEKCVAEFDITQLDVPSGRFRIRIYENTNGKFMGFTNLKIKNLFDGYPEGGVGNGNSITEALEDTIKNFMENLSENRILNDSDFIFVNYNEF